VLDKIRQFLSDIARTATVETVFGEPIQVGAKTIVPVAEVSVGLGLGFGTGHKAPKTTGDTKAEGPQECAEEGEGGGGGGRITARPVAIVEITDEQTKVIPIVDDLAVRRGKVILGALGCLALIVMARSAGKETQ